MVAFAEAETASDEQQQASSSITEIIHSHFESHQRGDNGNASRAAAALRHELLSFSLDADANIEDDNNDNDGGANSEISLAIVNCLDAAMATIATSSTKKDTWSDSVASTLELVAAFACHASKSKGSSSSSSCTDNTNNSHNQVARAVIERAVEFSSVEKDTIRIESCRLLAMCAEILVESNRPAASILKKKKNSKSSKNSKGSRGYSDNDNKESKSEVVVAANDGSSNVWKVECLLLIGNALLPRITDKIVKVRSAAIAASASLLSSEVAKQFFFHTQPPKSDELEATIQDIQNSLLWLMSYDSSAANRALVASTLPLEECFGGHDNNNIAPMIEWIKDVDVKVRVAALDSLREKITMEDLDENGRVEILRMGLTQRCPTTYAKTVELLITSWLKSTKFDPLLLLDKLNPTLNETICEQVSQVLLRVASMIDCETLTLSESTGALERGVMLVQGHFGAPEMRELRSVVLKKMTIHEKNEENESATGANDEEKEEDGKEGIGITDNNESIKLKSVIKPSLAIFLRVKCELASSQTNTNSTNTTISDVINDIPSLCNLLNAHIDSLIEFNSSEDYEEMDENAAAEYEDEMNFVCLQLIHMAKASELSEEGSRRHFISIMRRVLARLATPDDLVEACVKAMAAAHDKEAHFLQTISEILVDVEDDDTFQTGQQFDEKAIIIIRQMRIIAILTIVLENISGQLSGHPILDGFFEHLSPAITSKNAIIREHGVVCLSKFCLLSDEEKVMGEFKPLLMTIAGSLGEKVEVRAQAAMALCDLALIHERMLLSSSESEEEGRDGDVAISMPFKDMLLEMLGHSKPGIVIIAAEIAAKLLLAGRLRDPNLIAWLVLIYFDTSLTDLDLELDEEDADGSEVKEVGSPVRLQQLLSIFFPTYSMSSLDANDDLMQSVGPLLSIVNDKLLLGINQIGASSKEMMARWPIAKMVEYICYNVDLADKKKQEESASSSEEGVQEVEAELVGHIEQAVGDAGETDVEDGNGAEEAENDDNVEASSTLLATIDISSFLAEQSEDDTPTFYTRALSKILGSASIDMEAEDMMLLRRLKSSVNEAEYANDDGPTVRSIKKLSNLLVSVKDMPFEEEEESDADDDAQDVNISMEKENPRLSVGSVKSSTKQVAEEANTRRLSSRTSLGDVN